MATNTTIAASPQTLSVNVTPPLIEVEPGQMLVFTNDSTRFPKFQIEFEGGKSPASPGDKLTGTNKVEIHVLTDGEFKYRILHFPKSGCGCPSISTGDFSVRSCTGGCQ